MPNIKRTVFVEEEDVTVKVTRGMESHLEFSSGISSGSSFKKIASIRSLATPDSESDALYVLSLDDAKAFGRDLDATYGSNVTIYPKYLCGSKDISENDFPVVCIGVFTNGVEYTRFSSQEEVAENRGGARIVHKPMLSLLTRTEEDIKIVSGEGAVGKETILNVLKRGKNEEGTDLSMSLHEDSLSLSAEVERILPQDIFSAKTVLIYGSLGGIYLPQSSESYDSKIFLSSRNSGYVLSEMGAVR